MKLSFAISISKTDFDAVGQGDFREIIPYLSSIGYNGVELAIREPAKVPVRQLEELLASNRLAVPAIGTGQAYLSENISLSSMDSEIRRKAINRLEEHIDLANLLGANVIIGLIRGGILQKGEQKSGMYFLTESLMSLCAKAENKNVLLLIEPINRYETNLFPTLSSAAELINKIGSKKLRILMDTFHMNIEEADMFESIKEYGNLIGHVHLADSNRLAPGRGHINFKEIMRSLDKIDYNGFISFEILPQPSVEQAAEGAFNFIKKLQR